MSKRRLLWVAGLALGVLVLAFLIPPCRHAILWPFISHSPPPRRPGISNGFGGFNAAPVGGEDAYGRGQLLPGIDYCSHAYGSTESGFVFFVWGDFSGGAGGTFEESRGGLKFSGYLWNVADKRRAEFAGETKDGKTGEVTIAGKAYDLAQGTLFLVSARRGYRVKQLKRDMTRFRDAAELHNELRLSDPDVVAFFARALATSRDGHWTAIGKDNVFSLIEADSERVERQCDGHKDAVTNLAFTHDGTMLASGGKDKLVILWAVPGGEILKRFEVQDPVYSVEFGNDGKTLTVREAASPNDTTARVFDLQSGKQVDVSRAVTTPAPR